MTQPRPGLPPTFRIERISADRHHGIALDDHGHPEHALVAVALRDGDGWTVIDTIGSQGGLATEQEALSHLAEMTAYRLNAFAFAFAGTAHLDDDGTCLCSNRCCFGGFDALGRAVCICTTCTVTHDGDLFAPTAPPSTSSTRPAPGTGTPPPTPPPDHHPGGPRPTTCTEVP